MAMVLALGVPTAVGAITINADLDTGDCFSADLDDCVGGLYTLDVASTGTDEYQATITALYSDLFDFDPGADAFVSHIEIKVAGEYIDPLSASSGTVGDGPLSGGGCNGVNDGFLCVMLDPAEALEDSMSWTIDFGAESLLADTEWHLGMRFEWENPGNGKTNSALLSASSPIPEPSAALVFAVGFGVISTAVRRRSA
jgi:hypothetical protein